MGVQRLRRYGLFAGLQSSRQPLIPQSQHGIQSGRTGLEYGRCRCEKARFGKLPLGNGVGGASGKDSENFGFSATAPNVSGSDLLRPSPLSDVSYLAPGGKGVALQAALF